MQLCEQHASSGPLVSGSVLTSVARLQFVFVCSFSWLWTFCLVSCCNCLQPHTVNLGYWLCEIEGSSTGEYELLAKECVWTRITGKLFPMWPHLTQSSNPQTTSSAAWTGMRRDKGYKRKNCASPSPSLSFHRVWTRSLTDKTFNRKGQGKNMTVKERKRNGREPINVFQCICWWDESEMCVHNGHEGHRVDAHRLRWSQLCGQRRKRLFCPCLVKTQDGVG